MNIWTRHLCKCLPVALAAFIGCAKNDLPRPSGKLDLRPYGGGIDEWRGPLVSYNQLAFLSNELLLVSVNQREYTQSIEPLITDVPPASLLIYDVTKSAVVRSAKFSVEKDSHSVQPLTNARFVVWNTSGFHVCDRDLACSKRISDEVDGPVLSSPAGTSFVVGGYGDNDQRVVESGSLTETHRYPGKEARVAPGDGAILLRRGSSLLLRRQPEDGPERLLPFSEGADNNEYLLSSRFLNETTLGVSESDESLLVASVEGKSQYRIAVYPWYSGTALFTASLGTRFGVRDETNTRWNSIFQFYDFGRPRNLERIRIFEVETGRLLFEVQRDPRPYINSLALPALSPDGHHLALMHHGSLELYVVP